MTDNIDCIMTEWRVNKMTDLQDTKDLRLFWFEKYALLVFIR